MDIQDFSQRPPYGADSSRAYEARRSNSSTGTLMKESNRWSNYFRGVVDSHLGDYEVYADDVADKVSTYTSNAQRQLLRQVTGAVQRVSYEHPAVASYLNDLNFHTINQELAQYWPHLIEPEHFDAPTDTAITVMQTRLGVSAMQLLETRRQYLDHVGKNFLERNQDLPVDNSFVGQITEIEATMAMLEVVKTQQLEGKDPANLALVPAPFGYDRGARLNISSDMLLFDTRERQVIGLQTKTTLRGPGHYDTSRIAFVDGFHDLGNIASHEQEDGSVALKAHPGLLAADFILHNDALHQSGRLSRTEALNDSYGNILHAKQVAETLLPHLTYEQRIERAAENIGQRVLAALYDDEYKKELGKMTSSRAM